MFQNAMLPNRIKMYLWLTNFGFFSTAILVSSEYGLFKRLQLTCSVQYWWASVPRHKCQKTPCPQFVSMRQGGSIWCSGMRTHCSPCLQDHYYFAENLVIPPPVLALSKWHLRQLKMICWRLEFAFAVLQWGHFLRHTEGFGLRSWEGVR